MLSGSQISVKEYGLKTDIVFSRPNYCKIDLMVEDLRGDQLFMQADEMSKLKTLLSDHGLKNGLRDLIEHFRKNRKRKWHGSVSYM